jgi:hypothetical protein
MSTSPSLKKFLTRKAVSSSLVDLHSTQHALVGTASPSKLQARASSDISAASERTLEERPCRNQLRAKV